MATIILKGSVGAGTAKGGRPHNDPDDFRQIRKRLNELGFTWVAGLRRGSDKEFIRTIRLFQCIYKGRHKLDQGDGRIDPGLTTHKWLAAENAPGWVQVYGKYGLGWRCTNDFVNSNGGYATTWLLDGISRAGLVYSSKLLGDGVRRAIKAPPMWVRECAPTRGGDAKGHGSHETGLDVDMRLPLLPPDDRKWIKLPRGFRDKRFDRAASQTQLEAIKAQMNTRFVFFNDPALRRMKLCSKENATHDNHYHIRIRPPAKRVEGTVTVYALASRAVEEAYDKMTQTANDVYEWVEDLFD